MSPQPARAKASASSYPLRRTLKGALATLVLLRLALLFWQLLDQLQQTRKNQRQHAIDYSAELADHLSLNLALNAQIALNLLPIVESPQDSQQQQQLLHKLQRSLPDVRSFALLDASGQILSDSASDSHDSPWLAELIQRSHLQRYYYSNPADGSVVHVLLLQSSGASP
ncbi:diguanylate phosphodiesterase, partial [Pseudomonas sp. MWU12-2115]